MSSHFLRRWPEAATQVNGSKEWKNNVSFGMIYLTDINILDFINKPMPFFTYKQLSNISNPSSAIACLMVSGGKRVSVFPCVVNNSPFFKLFC